MPVHTARDLDKDLKRADIPKYGPTGKLDFHACRVAYINLVIESGVTVKEAQALARHSTPQLTMNVYGRVREKRLAEVVEKVAVGIFEDEKCHMRATNKNRHRGGFYTPSTPVVYADKQIWRWGELNPRPKMSKQERLHA